MNLRFGLKTQLHKLLFGAFIVVTGAGIAQAATYYVSTSGNDSNPGTQSAPFRHVSRGVSAAYAGDTVVVMDGTYDNEGQVAQSSGGGSVVTVSHAGTAGSPITIMAEHRGGAILNAASTTQAWIGCYGAWAYFDVSYTSFVVIQGFVIENACFLGVNSNGNAHDITIRWNEFRNIGNWNSPGNSWNPQGLYLNRNEYNFTIDGNSFHDIGGGTHINLQHGIYAQARNVTIVNNIFYNQNYGWDIQVSEGNNIVIANNTFAFQNPNRTGQIVLYDGGVTNSVSNVLIENNIFYGAAGSAVVGELDGGGGIANCHMQYNITTASGIWDNAAASGGGVTCPQNNNLTGVNPNLVNVSSTPYDFHLQPGSPAIASGITDSWTTLDLDGWTRGIPYDLGAYKYQESIPSSISLSATPSSVSVVQGSAVSTSVTATVTGSASPSFTASGLPAGVTASFSPSSCSGSCTTTLTLSATGTYQGSASVTIGAASSGLTASTALGLTVNPVPISTAPVSSNPSGGDYTTGLVARWSLAGTATDSVAGANGTLHGGASWGTGQNNGGSFTDLQFDGSSGYVSVGEAAQLEMTQQLTVSFWLRSAPGSTSDPRIIAKVYDWDIKLNGNLYPQFSGNGGYAETNYPLPFYTWAHIVFTYSGGFVKAYVNGQPVGFQANTFTAAGALPNNPYGLNIGTDSSVTSFLSGALNDVRIYSRALSATDVSALYYATTPGTNAGATSTPAPTGDYTNGLVGRWKLLGSATDSIKGANGTLHGAASWGSSSYNGVSFRDLQLAGTNGYVSIAEASQLEMTQQLTVSFWLQAGSSSTSDPRVISKVYDWDIKLNNMHLQFSAGSNYAELSSTFPLSTWTHVVFTFSGGSVKAYVNGKPAGFQTNTFTSASTLPSYQYGLYFGTDSSVTAFLGGALSDVRIYNRALSAADVTALYASVTPATLI